MEKLPTLIKLEKRSLKSSQKTPVKVVYISNPMKIKATPSEFRAVVQQFTGRYATSPPPEALAPATNHDCKQEVGFAGCGVHREQKWQLDRTSTIVDARLTTAGSDLSHKSGCREDDQGMDDLITPQMLESFPPLFTHDFGS